jgi:putative tricarboxylic transport membrane protein
MRASALAPVVLIAIAVIGFSGALSLGLWQGPMPGSGLFPLISSVLLAILALIDFAARLRSSAAVAPKLSWRRPAVYVASLLVFACSMTPLGFFLAATLGTGIALRFAERRPWRVTVAVTLCAVAGVWALFELVLGVPLPHAPFELS